MKATRRRRAVLDLRPGPVQSAFEQAGFTDVETGSVEITSRFNSFEDYWAPFLGGAGPAGSYVATLDDHQREQLVTALKDTVNQSSDGSIELPARAWTAVSTRRATVESQPPSIERKRAPAGAGARFMFWTVLEISRCVRP